MIPLPSLSILVIFALFICPKAALADEIDDDIISWVRSMGGFISEKIEFRRRDRNDDTSPFGVFASDDFKALEHIMTIPHDCYIHIWDQGVENMELETEEATVNAYRNNLLKLSQRLGEEMEKGDKSKYAPYVAYLKTQKTGQLPAAWSEDGRNVLRKLLPVGSDVVDWLENIGFTNSTHPLEHHLMAMTVQRCFDVALIPAWDMVNHDNGLINTETTSLYAKGGTKVWATKHIVAGEEMYHSYDKCADCMDVASYWGTTEILRDFGFVERYPQRWVFPDKRIWFEIWEYEGELYVYWDEPEAPGDEAYGLPDKEGIDFIRAEWERLQTTVHEDELLPSLPEHELRVILEYKEAAITAMKLALEAAENAEEAAAEVAPEL
jgi:hypothetical protein